MGKTSLFVEFRNGKIDDDTHDYLNSGIYFTPFNGKWYAFVFEDWNSTWDDWGEGTKVYGARLNDGYFVAQHNWDGELWKLFKGRFGDAA